MTNRSIKLERELFPDGPGVQLDGVGEICEDHVQGLGVPVVQQHPHRLPGSSPAPARLGQVRNYYYIFHATYFDI